MALYGFVRPASGEVVWFIANAIDAAMFSALLEAFAREIGAGPDKHVILVLDGAGSHLAKDLEIPEGLELMFLPAYSILLAKSLGAGRLRHEPGKGGLTCAREWCAVQPCGEANQVHRGGCQYMLEMGLRPSDIARATEMEGAHAR